MSNWFIAVTRLFAGAEIPASVVVISGFVLLILGLDF